MLVFLASRETDAGFPVALASSSHHRQFCHHDAVLFRLFVGHLQKALSGHPGNRALRLTEFMGDAATAANSQGWVRERPKISFAVQWGVIRPHFVGSL